MAPARYRITVRGRLGDRFSTAFDGMTLESAAAETVLVGLLRDQAHLHGILNRIQDFGLELVAVQQVSRGSGAGTTSVTRFRPGP